MGVLTDRAVLLGVYIRAPDFWELHVLPSPNQGHPGLHKGLSAACLVFL